MVVVMAAWRSMPKKTPETRVGALRDLIVLQLLTLTIDKGLQQISQDMVALANQFKVGVADMIGMYLRYHTCIASN